MISKSGRYGGTFTHKDIAVAINKTQILSQDTGIQEKMKFIKTVLTLFLFIIINVNATTGGDVKYICPIDSIHFEAYTIFSSFNSGMRLDFRKMGLSPDPWPLPKCPKCGFVLFKANFKEKELKEIKKYILSNIYKNYKGQNNSYACFAMILSSLKSNNDGEMAFNFLRASWIEEDNDKNKCEEYLKESLKFYTRSKGVNVPKKSFRKRKGIRNNIIAHYMIIEINRRLGNFEEAKNLIESFHYDLHRQEKWILDYIKQQEILLKCKDKYPRQPDEISANCIDKNTIPLEQELYGQDLQ